MIDREAPAIRRRLRAGSGDGDRGRPAFVDGLLLGAMVGAAIAGSTLWTRWQARHRPKPPAEAPER